MVTDAQRRLEESLTGTADPRERKRLQDEFGETMKSFRMIANLTKEKDERRWATNSVMPVTSSQPSSRMVQGRYGTKKT